MAVRRNRWQPAQALRRTRPLIDPPAAPLPCNEFPMHRHSRFLSIKGPLPSRDKTIAETSPAPSMMQARMQAGLELLKARHVSVSEQERLLAACSGRRRPRLPGHCVEAGGSWRPAEGPRDASPTWRTWDSSVWRTCRPRELGGHWRWCELHRSSYWKPFQMCGRVPGA